VGAAKAEVAARVREISRRGVRVGFIRGFLK
jgi:UDP-2,3-diacylglucosamine pyrophosphatase LpxH